MSNIRLLAIVLLATAAFACKIDPLPARTTHDAATDMGKEAGRESGAKFDAADAATLRLDSNGAIASDLSVDTPANSGTRAQELARALAA